MYPSRADVGGWVAEGTFTTVNRETGEVTDHRVGNVALRLPPGVLGIDVDAYGEKVGAASIATAEAELGPLPATWIATSRPGTPAGIRLYRVPEGLTWRGLRDVDPIHAGVRYVTAAPSIHPATGNAYVWLDPDGTMYGDAEALPRAEELPELPTAWVDYLSRPATTSANAGPVDADTVAAAIAGMPKGDPCACITRAAGKTLVTTGARHDAYLTATLAVLRYGRRGCPGAQATLTRMRAAFMAEVTGDGSRTPQQAATEWRGMFTGNLVGDVLADPQGSRCRYAEAAEDVAEDTGQTPEDAADNPDVARRMRVLTHADELRVRAEARELVAAETAAANYDPPPVLTLPQLIATTEAERVRWRWEGLAQIGDRILIEAGAKTGKTTLLANAVRCALDGTPLLDHFTTTPLATGERLVYLDTELGPRRLARWLGEVLTPEQRARVVVWSIAGRAGSLDVRDTATRQRMAGQLTKALAGDAAGLLIVDVASAWTAPLGIDENSNAEVRRWLESVHALALDVGAAGLALAHHAGHSAERSRGASAYRDWPDAYVTLTRGTEDNDKETRYFAAAGRDVHVPESKLRYDRATRRLSIAGALGTSRRDAARQRLAEDYAATVAAVVAETPGLNTTDLRTAVGRRLRAEGVTPKAVAVAQSIYTARDKGLITDAKTGRASNWQPANGRGQVAGQEERATAGLSRLSPKVSPLIPPVPEGVPTTEGQPVPVPALMSISANTETHPNGTPEALPWEVTE